ncbi:MAG TPA: porin [Gemmata sp.]|nr:porin [Gemmata sp.]
MTSAHRSAGLVRVGLVLVGLGWLGMRAAAQEPGPPPRTTETPLSEAVERIRVLEEQNKDLLNQIDDIRRELGLQRAPAPPIREAPLGNLQGQLGRPLPPGRDVIETGEEGLARARVDLSQGVRFLSPDGRYRIELHDLTQFEGRFFNVTGSRPEDLHDNFAIPRQRLYFTGQIAEHFDFYSVLNRGYGSLELLDSYVNLKFDTKFNVRLGRTKTPYTYEYYKIVEGDLIAPERSVFVGNLAPNRQIGVMAFGRLLDQQLEYAVGLFNGPHNSFQDFNNFKNVFFYINTKPFLYSGIDVIKELNLGGSVNFGREDDPLEPNALHTANDETISPNVDNVSPTFLRFNKDAVEKGATAFWSGDVAWYYRSMTALAMYNGGYLTYSLPTRSGIRVPFEGGSVALTFFLTGEEISSRKEVEPLRPFDWHNPLTHPGAIELYSRVGYVNAGANVFTTGLADPRLWSNDALVFDTGFNWYLNRFVRVFVDWQHAIYGSPVQVGPNRLTNSTDMFWLRSQIYY